MLGLPDDVVYALLIVTSVGVGPVFKHLNDVKTRRWTSTLIGFVLLVLVCGEHVLHLIVTILGNCILINLFPPSRKNSNLPWKSFLWNFGYLALFRTVHYLGIPAPSPVTNAAQLFLTLRMIGIAFEIQDSFVPEKQERGGGDCDLDPQEKRKQELQLKYCKVEVTSLDLISYAFCYIGLLTGPYYKYRTFQDWLHLPSDAHLNIRQKMTERLMQLPLLAVCFVFFSYFFSIKYVETEEFLDLSYSHRLLYMVPMFIIFRTRLYMAWILSEIMSMTSGLGAVPMVAKPKCGQGATDYEMLEEFYASPTATDRRYDFETVHNINIWGCELAPMTKQGLRSWNMTVQYWLATYIHRRVPTWLKAYRVAITMAVSAFWHGIHPGYYLSFLTVPFILMAEDVCIKAFRNDASPRGQKIFDWFCWFFKMRGFDYECMGFLLLRLGATVRYWQSIYFTGHLVILFFIVIGNVALMIKPKKAKIQ